MTLPSEHPLPDARRGRYGCARPMVGQHQIRASFGYLAPVVKITPMPAFSLPANCLRQRKRLLSSVRDA